MTHQTLYPANLLAARCGLTKRRVLQMLEGTPAAGQAMVRDGAGREVPAQGWALESLPESLTDRLEKNRTARYRTLADYLADIREPWRPILDGKPVTWNDLASTCQERATRRCQALRPALESMFREPGNQERLRELEQAAARDLACTPIQVKRWLERVLARDDGNEQFDRVELYLDERLTRKTTPAELKVVVLDQLPEPIQDSIAKLENLQSPTREDRYDLWKRILAAGATLENAIAARKARGHAVRNLIARVLKAAPGLARSLDSAVRVYYQKRNQVLASGSFAALEDKRPMASGNYRRPDFAKDEQVITALAVQHGGRESLAQRRAYRNGLLSASYVQYYGLDRKIDKGEVPRATRESVTGTVNSLDDIHHGRRQHALNRSSIRRDWSDCEPADWFTSDDLTAPIYFKAYNPAGEVVITRGQFLPLMDEKTNFILGWLLIPRRSYTALDIRRLVLSTHDKFGLPHIGFYFEQGIWKARLIDGDRKGNGVKWRDTERMIARAGDLAAVQFTNADAIETGLNDPRLGTSVQHATLPRAKSVEGVLGLLQNLMESEPCYVGRNEMVEKFESTQQTLTQARGGLQKALEKLPWLDEWAPRLEAIVQEYNDTPQPGSRKILGQKPIDAFNAGMARRPLRKLPEEMRYLLTSHRKEAVIGKQGIRVTISGQPSWYTCKEAGAREGEKVVAYWDIEDPSRIYCTRLDGSEPFVARLLALPSKTATAKEIAAVRQIQREHVGAIQDKYSQVKPYFLQTITRDDQFAQRDRETGRRIAAEKEAAGKARREQAASKRKAESIAREIGAVLPENHPDPDRVRRSLEREQEIINRMREQQEQPT